MFTDSTGTNKVKDFFSKVGRFLGGIALTVVGGTISLLSVLPALFNPGATVICEFGLTLGFYGVTLVGSVFDKQIEADLATINWNPYNTNELLAINTSKVSFYKGVPIIRKSGRSGSFGIILLDPNDNEEDLRHEFGHIPQLMSLGIVRYGLCIGIPSWKCWEEGNLWTYYEIGRASCRERV